MRVRTGRQMVGSNHPETVAAEDGRHARHVREFWRKSEWSLQIVNPIGRLTAMTGHRPWRELVEKTFTPAQRRRMAQLEPARQEVDRLLT